MMTHRERFDALCAEAEKLMHEHAVPGMCLGVLADGVRQVWASGITHAHHPLPVTDTTCFQIGSITKTYTGLALLCLQEQGRLDLDVPVRAYLPDFAVADAQASATVTTRHLLTHTAGWFGDFFPDTGSGDDALRRYVALMSCLPQLAPPGMWHSYNNAGYAVAGLLIEQLMQMPYEDALAQLVLHPLGLRRSWFDPNTIMTERFVVGHFADDKAPAGQRIARPWSMPRNINAMGRLSCDIHDILTYAAFHLGDGAPLLRRETFAWLRQPERSIVTSEPRLGLVWALDTWGEHTVQRHYGTTEGQAALLVLAADHNLALAVLTNAQSGVRLRQAVYQRFLTLFLDVAVLPPQRQFAPPSQLTTFTGHFATPAGAFELRMEEDRLLAEQITGPSHAVEAGAFQLDLCGDDRLIALDGPYAGFTFEMLRDGAGRVGWLRLLERIYPRWISAP